MTDSTEVITEEILDIAAEKLYTRTVFGECWEWQGALSTKGYGRIRIKGRLYQVHRLAFCVRYGYLTPGLTIDHLCRNKKCWRPTHLEEVTWGENVLRAPLSAATINKAKTHCPKGHDYYVRASDGKRRCRTCERARDRARYARKKAAA